MNFKVVTIIVIGDSQLVVNQLVEKYKVHNDILGRYHTMVVKLIEILLKSQLNLSQEMRIGKPMNWLRLLQDLKSLRMYISGLF